MIGMALGQTVAERISTTVVTNEVPTGAATEPITEATSEATTEAALEAASVAGVAAGETTMVVGTIYTGTRTGALLHDTDQGGRAALPTGGTGEKTTCKGTVLRKSHPSSTCQIPPNLQDPHVKKARMSLDATSDLLHRSEKQSNLPIQIRIPDSLLYSSRHPRCHQIHLTKVPLQHLLPIQYLLLPIRHPRLLQLSYLQHHLSERTDWTRLICQLST